MTMFLISTHNKQHGRDFVVTNQLT